MVVGGERGGVDLIEILPEKFRVNGWWAENVDQTKLINRKTEWN